MPRKAVIFDLDGTLLDTVADLAEAMNTALTAHGLPTRPDLDEHKKMVGEGVATYVTRALPPDRRGDDDLIAAVTADYRAAYAAGWRNHTRPYEGVIELLAELRRRSVRLAVLSNKPDDTTAASVEALLPGGAFEIVRGAGDAFPLKPDPAGALAIAAGMDIPPAEFAYLGDTATDMKTARNAGMLPIGALWGFRDRDELLTAGAEALIAHPAELLDLL